MSWPRYPAPRRIAIFARLTTYADPDI